MRKIPALAVAAFLLFSLSSCASSLDSSEDEVSAGLFYATSVAEALTVAQENGLDWEAAIFADGTITAAEYEDAHDRFIQCQKDLGMVMKYDKWLDPIDGLGWHSIVAWDGDDVPEGLADITEVTCEQPYYLVQQTYLTVTPHRMDPSIIPLYQKCLTKNGVTFTGAERSVKEFIGDSDPSAAIMGVHGDCAWEALTEFRPNGPNALGLGDLGP